MRFFYILSIILVLFSCKKDDFITSPEAILKFSADSLKFDTVFTTVGSVTQSFKIINNNKKKILISEVYLNSASAFKLNIDGVAGNNASNIEVPANDSIYVYVTVKINPDASQLPFLVSDSIKFLYNNNTKFIQLQAYGRNANFLRDSVISTSTTFNSALPYVILGSLKIDEGATLNLSAGTELYFHADAPLLVNGTLKVNGTYQNKVVFKSDRLDEYYRDLPGSWPGIYFSETSANNIFTFAEIKNAVTGISSTEGMLSTPKIILQQCIIDNCYDAGIFLDKTSADISNTLISNCNANIKIRRGGNYSFTFCTVVSYSTRYLRRTSPVFSVFDFNEQQEVFPLNATIVNSIFYGDNLINDELELINFGSDFNAEFKNCIYKSSFTPVNAMFESCMVNQNPEFINIDEADFRILTGPAIDNGISTPFLKDLDDYNREVGLPDIGAYERQ